MGASTEREPQSKRSLNRKGASIEEEPQSKRSLNRKEASTEKEFWRIGALV